MEQSMTTLRALLRQNRNYRYTWMAQVVSEIGDYFNNIAVFALVMEKSGSGLVVTGVMLARAIPAVLAGPVAGVLLDRLDRKRIMIASDLVRALLALGFVLTVHQPRPWLLYVLSAGLMFASPFFTAGRAAILPTIATPDELHAANSLTQTTQWATLTAGTLLAGYSAAWLGYHWAFVLNSLSFVFSAWAIWQISVPGGFRVAREDTAPATRPWHEYRAGLSYMRSVPLMMGMAMISVGWSLVRPVRRAGLPPRPERHRFHLGVRWYRPVDRRRHRAHRRPKGELRRIQAHRDAVVPVARRRLHAVQPGGIVHGGAGVYDVFARRHGGDQRAQQRATAAPYAGPVPRARVQYHGIDPLERHDCLHVGGGHRLAVRGTPDHRAGGRGLRIADGGRVGVDGLERPPAGAVA
jgi:hypothetical protein